MIRRQDMVGTYRKLLAGAPKRERDKYALALCVRVLDLLAKNAVLPSEANLAGALADAIRDLVPEGVGPLLPVNTDRDR